MMTLWWAMATLVAIALLFVCYPFFRQRGVVGTGAVGEGEAAANVALFREHLGDLEAQLERGEINAEQLAVLTVELERTLLEESDLAEGATHIARKRGQARWLLWCLLILIPLLAFSLYKQLGSSQDLTIVEMLEQASRLGQMGDTSKATRLRRDLLVRIGDRLDQDPENFYYWVLTARLRTEEQNHAGALEAYRRALPLSPQDVTLLEEYLQSAFLVSGGQSTDEISGLVDRILILSPDNLPVLGLSGRVAKEAGDYQRAIQDWQKVLAVLPPEHEMAKMLAAEIEAIRVTLSDQGEALPETSATVVQIRVALAPKLPFKAGDTLFVIARRSGQQGAPLAVKRLQLAQLPLLVQLDDSNMMLPGSSFAGVSEIELTARISRSGEPMAQPGDLQGQVSSVAVGGGVVTDLVIDQVIE